MMIEQHERGDPAVHAAADVERLLASASALERIVDLAREQSPEGTARAGERSGPTRGYAGPGMGPAADQCWRASPSSTWSLVLTGAPPSLVEVGDDGDDARGAISVRRRADGGDEDVIAATANREHSEPPVGSRFTPSHRPWASGLVALVAPFQELAFAVGVRVLVDAFVVRSLLVPRPHRAGRAVQRVGGQAAVPTGGMTVSCGIRRVRPASNAVYRRARLSGADNCLARRLGAVRQGVREAGSGVEYRRQETPRWPWKPLKRAFRSSS
jgi:hypothetical protein